MQIATTDPIRRALVFTGGTHTREDVEAGVREGRFQRFDGEDSSIVTEILETPRIKGIHFFLAAGNLRELEAMVPPILTWAKSIGCTRATFTGRFGWQRSFVKKLGFRETAVMMTADL